MSSLGYKICQIMFFWIMWRTILDFEASVLEHAHPNLVDHHRNTERPPRITSGKSLVLWYN